MFESPTATLTSLPPGGLISTSPLRSLYTHIQRRPTPSTPGRGSAYRAYSTRNLSSPAILPTGTPHYGETGMNENSSGSISLLLLVVSAVVTPLFIVTLQAVGACQRSVAHAYSRDTNGNPLTEELSFLLETLHHDPTPKAHSLNDPVWRFTPRVGLACTVEDRSTRIDLNWIPSSFLFRSDIAFRALKKGVSMAEVCAVRDTVGPVGTLFPTYSDLIHANATLSTALPYHQINTQLLEYPLAWSLPLATDDRRRDHNALEGTLHAAAVEHQYDLTRTSCGADRSPCPRNKRYSSGTRRYGESWPRKRTERSPPPCFGKLLAHERSPIEKGLQRWLTTTTTVWYMTVTDGETTVSATRYPPKGKLPPIYHHIPGG